jgi:predicted transcriptional regulator
MSPPSEPFTGWLTALEQRHLANLRPSEVSRALRSLSTYYVERRSKLAQGAALNTAGKRAAFALFYGPIHFLVTREIVTAIERARYVAQILDLGCGSGAAGAAWALASGRCTINGIDKHPWTIDEANWTYRQLEITGYAGQGDISRAPIRGRKGHGILAAYSVNELDDDTRARLLDRLAEAKENGSHILIIEPIAKRALDWWTEWEARFRGAGGRADEWRFRVDLPERQRSLGRAAGLDPRELTARSLWM